MKTIEQIFTEKDIDKSERSILRFGRLCRKELYPLVFKGQQFLIWDQLLITMPLTTGQISENTGIPSKNVATQLNQMMATGLINFTRTGKLKSWTRID